MKDVAAGIVVRDGRVLLTRRGPGQHLAGYWEFPGGKVEAGETVQACIERELAEELSITCEAGEIVAQHVHRYDGGAINLIAVRVSTTSDHWHLSVHDEARWVGPDALLSFDLAPADVPIACKVRELLLALSGEEGRRER